LLSVVIPALNSASTISHTLSSIFSNKFPNEMLEVLVIDNGSFDRTVEVASRYPVKIGHCAKKGIGLARNFGIRMAEGDIICFTDSDCIVEKDWLKRIFNFFQQNPEADGVGGPVFPYPYNQNKIQKLAGELFVEDQGYPREIRKIQFGSLNGLIFGSNSAYKKKVLTLVGGFSEGGSNLELSWRLASMKRNLFFNPDIKTYHIFPWALRSILKQQFRWGSQLTYMRRVNGLTERTKEIATGSYFLTRRLLSLLVPKNLDKRMLHFAQLASYSFGQIYGYD